MLSSYYAYIFSKTGISILLMFIVSFMSRNHQDYCTSSVLCNMNWLIFNTLIDKLVHINKKYVCIQ